MVYISLPMLILIAGIALLYLIKDKYKNGVAFIFSAFTAVFAGLVPVHVLANGKTQTEILSLPYVGDISLYIDAVSALFILLTSTLFVLGLINNFHLGDKKEYVKKLPILMLYYLFFLISYTLDGFLFSVIFTFTAISLYYTKLTDKCFKAVTVGIIPLALLYTAFMVLFILKLPYLIIASICLILSIIALIVGLFKSRKDIYNYALITIALSIAVLGAVVMNYPVMISGMTVAVLHMVSYIIAQRLYLYSDTDCYNKQIAVFKNLGVLSLANIPFTGGFMSCVLLSYCLIMGILFGGALQKTLIGILLLLLIIIAVKAIIAAVQEVKLDSKPDCKVTVSFSQYIALYLLSGLTLLVGLFPEIIVRAIMPTVSFFAESNIVLSQYGQIFEILHWTAIIIASLLVIGVLFEVLNRLISKDN